MTAFGAKRLFLRLQEKILRLAFVCDDQLWRICAGG
jgi:hypothetical protein